MLKLARGELCVLLVAGGACGRLDFNADSSVAIPALVRATGDIADNFEDGMPAAFWYVYDDTGTAPAVEAGGQLQIFAANQSAEAYSGYVTKSQFDSTNTGSWVELAASPASVVGADCSFDLTDGTNRLFMTWVEGTLTGGIKMPPISPTTVKAGVWFPEARWGRIRVGATTVDYEYSADGSNWTSFGTLPTPSFVHGVYLDVGGGSYLAIPAQPVCQLASVNIPP